MVSQYLWTFFPLTFSISFIVFEEISIMHFYWVLLIFVDWFWLWEHFYSFSKVSHNQKLLVGKFIYIYIYMVWILLTEFWSMVLWYYQEEYLPNMQLNLNTWGLFCFFFFPLFKHPENSENAILHIWQKEISSDFESFWCIACYDWCSIKYYLELYTLILFRICLVLILSF